MSYAGDYGQHPPYGGDYGQQHAYGSYDPYGQQPPAPVGYDAYGQQQAYQDPYAAQGGGGYDQYAAGGYYAQSQPAADPYTQTKPAFVPPPNTQVRVLYDYVATEKGVLSLRAGEVTTMVEHKDQGWCILRTAAGQEGYFPQSYVEPAGTTTPGAPVTAPNQTIRCTLHGKNRSAGNMVQEYDPMNPAALRWVCKTGCECKGALLPGVAPSPQHNPQLGQQPTVGTGAPTSAAGVFAAQAAAQQAQAQQAQAAAAAAAAYQPPMPMPQPFPQQPAVNQHQLNKTQMTVKLEVIQAHQSGDKNILSHLKVGDVCELIRPEANGWNLVKGVNGTAGFFPSAFLKPCQDMQITRGQGAAAAPAAAAAAPAVNGAAAETAATAAPEPEPEAGSKRGREEPEEQEEPEAKEPKADEAE